MESPIKSEKILFYKRVWFSPVMLAFGLILTLLILAIISLSNDKENSQSQIEATGVQVGEFIEMHLQAKVDYLELLAEEMSSGHLDEKLFQSRLTKYVDDHPCLINVVWADSEFHIRWTAPYEANKQIIGLSLSLPEPERASHEAALTKMPVWTKPFEVIQGKPAIEVYVPIFKDNEFFGTFSGVLSIEDLLKNILQPSLHAQYQISIADANGHFYGIGIQSIFNNADLNNAFQVDLLDDQVSVVLLAIDNKTHWSQLGLITLCICLLSGMTYSMWSLRQSLLEQKHAEKNLKDSEKKYRLIFETAANLINSVDSDGTIVDCNGRIEEVLGYKRDEIIGQNLELIIHPDYHVIAMNSLGNLISTRAPQYNEYKMIKKDGSIIVVNINSSSIVDQHYKFVRSICIIDDITESKNAEDALRESERKLNEAQRIAQLGYYALNIKTGTWSNSDELNRIFGIDDNYMRDVASWLQIVHPDYQEEMSEYFHQLILVKHNNFDKVYKIIDNSSGQEKWVHGLGSLTFDHDGNILGMFGTIQDISLTKRNKDAIKESEEKFRTYIANAPDAVFVGNSEGHCIEVNQAACSLTGYSKSELARISLTDIIAPDSKSELLEGFEVFKKIGTLKTEIKLRQKDGTIIWTSLNAVALSEDRYIVFCSDITEIKRLQELESRAQRLETAGTIAGQVAHDFNNLLAPMMAYPEIISEELPDNHPSQKYLDQIERAAQKMADINQDLLAMGRRGHFNQEVLNLNTVIEHTLAELEPYPETMNYKTNLDNELIPIMGGGAQLHRMINNILNNARDAMQGSGQITITTENYYVDNVSVRFGRVPQGDYIKLTISDTGCGMDEEIVKKIFDPFYTTKVTDKKRGSGLGMSVVDAVIKDHNGFIDMSTKIDDGTSFYIYFPITREIIDTDDSTIVCGGTESILIVDDDDTQREVYSQLLMKLGYTVNTVESGEKAIEYLADNPHDLLILDMVMPGGIDGTETFQQVLDINPNQKAIIVSGFSESDRVQEAQKLGVGAFVKKPIAKKAIALAIRTELDRQETVLV